LRWFKLALTKAELNAKFQLAHHAVVAAVEATLWMMRKTRATKATWGRSLCSGLALTAVAAPEG